MSDHDKKTGICKAAQQRTGEKMSAFYNLIEKSFIHVIAGLLRSTEYE